MKTQYFEKWKVDISSSSKLQFFSIFKDNYEVEPYLNTIGNFDQRRQYTKLRISNHKLAIESGRFHKTSIEDRLCTLCNDHKIESEIHMLYNCAYFGDLRKELLNKIGISIDDHDQSDYSKLTFDLFHSTDETTIQYFSKFIFKCFKYREEKLNSQ